MAFPKEVEMSYTSTHGETCYVSDTQAPSSWNPGTRLESAVTHHLVGEPARQAPL